MYISSISIKKFRHLENERLGPFRPHGTASDLVVFAGPNGSGKSSVLELIGYALSNSYSLNWSISRTFAGFSFEVGIGLSSEERRIIIEALSTIQDQQIGELRQSIHANQNIPEDRKEEQLKTAIADYKRNERSQYEMLEYLRTNNVYYRAFEYDDGHYNKNPQLHNQLHSWATRQLKDTLKRSLGFFLRSDRYYPQRGFDQNRIFAFQSTARREHLFSMAFNTSEIQYQDMYEFLVQQRYHYLRDLGNYHNQKKRGSPVEAEPTDPIIPYEDLLQRILPDYRFADKNEYIPSNLFIQIPSGEIITFNDLSSGEKEVFFILAFFIRHNVKNAILLIDEPELHLHPELSRLLIREMKRIQPGNQIWIATHNAEIIDEAGRDKVIYVWKDSQTRQTAFVTGAQEERAIILLRNMFGFSGYIGVARNLVFLEGDNSSQDRKFYGALFSGDGSNFKLVPSSGGGDLRRLNAATLAILESNLGWMNFFLIRDRDYLTGEMVEKYRSHPSGRLFVLSKHELENYLLDFEVLSAVLRDIFDIQISDAELKDLFYALAIKLSSSVLRDMIAYRLNLTVSPQDFSQGNVLAGEPYFDRQASTCVRRDTYHDVLKGRFLASAARVSAALASSLSEVAVAEMIRASEIEVKTALESDGWLSLFPGKELMELAAKQLKIANVVSLQNSVIKELGSRQERIDAELRRIFAKIQAS